MKYNYNKYTTKFSFIAFNLIHKGYSSKSYPATLHKDTLELKLKEILQENIITTLDERALAIKDYTSDILNIVPTKFYNNAEIDKYTIYKENKNKSGIYR